MPLSPMDQIFLSIFMFFCQIQMLALLTISCLIVQKETAHSFLRRKSSLAAVERWSE